MYWYGGSIAEAVTLSKQKNAIFVVFVEGDNDLSVEMAATIDNAAVVSRLSNQTDFLAVKLKSGTTNYTHFAQIYQFVPVPSLFFIGRNGTPLEVVCAGVQPDNLATRIDRILAEHHGVKPPPPSQPSTSSSSHGIHATVNLLQSEVNASAPVNIPGPKKTSDVPEAPSPPKILKSTNPTPETTQTSGKDYEVVCDGDVCVRRPKNVDQPSTSQAPMVTPTAPVVTPKVPLVTPTAPVVTPKVSLVTPTAPVVTPKVPLVTPTAPVISGTNVAARVPENMSETSSSETSIDEKLERAKELIEAKRREKLEQEKELERQRELERRNTGQGVAELKKWQADQEMKQLQEERKREKLENNLARQRILEQIAQDRAERKARDLPPVPLPTPAPAAAQATSHLPTSGDAGASARVQFKLPDGSSHTAHFDASGTLAHLQTYVADNLQLSASSFALWTAFPRRELTATTATLRELSLAPSAALLVLPRRAATAPDVNKQPARLYVFISQLLTTLFYEPSLALYTWIRRRLFPPPAVTPRPPTTPTTTPTTAPSTGPIPRAGPLPRRRTNIHRLPGDAANDDDNNTWNGNSTQQM